MTEHSIPLPPALAGAIDAARRGVPVIPCDVQIKKPKLKTPQKLASADPKRIAEWAQEFPDCNWGTYPGLGGETVIDLDNHAGKNGKAELEKWAASLGHTIPPTHTVRTPSGGLHLYFKGVAPLERNGFLTGVDIHTSKMLVILPGSRNDKGARYTDLGGETAPLPDWIVEELSKEAGKYTRTTAKAGKPSPASSDDFASILAEIAAIETVPCGKRDDTAIRLCLDWKERGMDHNARLQLLKLVPFEPGDSPLTDDDFQRISLSAESKASAVYQSKTAAALFGEALEDVYSAADLPSMDVKPPEFLIEGLLPVGLSFVAGPPKFGKTYLNLQLAVAVASGADFLGFHVERARKVLYFYLEGDVSQVKKRMTDLYGESFRLPRDLWFKNKLPPLDGGGRVVLRKFIQTMKPELIIIDTWQLIRPENVGAKGQTSYQKEYTELTLLRNEIIDTFGVSVLLTHHTKQVSMGRGDYVDAIEKLNGSTALGGSADTIILLNGRRGEETATLTAHGRSIEDVSLPLVKTHPMGWKVSESASTPLVVAETDLQRAILRALEEHSDGLKANELMPLMPPGTKGDSVRRQLNRWYEDGKIDKAGKAFRLYRVEWEKQDNKTKQDNDPIFGTGTFNE